MRLYEIQTNQNSKLNLRFESIWNNIVIPKCSEIISIYKESNKVLYRGIENSKSIIKGSSNPNRKPRDSDIFFSELVDFGLKETGMTAIRSNSYFAVSNEPKALYYGQSYIIFPLNGFQYTYTSQGDLVLSKQDYIDNYRNLYRNDDTYYMIQDVFDKRYQLYNSSWVNKLLDSHDTLYSGLVKINTFLQSNNQSKITATDLIDMTKFRKRLNPKNTNIISAINNKKELMLTGKYYAFSSFLFKNIIFAQLKFLKT